MKELIFTLAIAVVAAILILTFPWYSGIIVAAFVLFLISLYCTKGTSMRLARVTVALTVIVLGIYWGFHLLNMNGGSMPSVQELIPGVNALKQEEGWVRTSAPEGGNESFVWYKPANDSASIEWPGDLSSSRIDWQTQGWVVLDLKAADGNVTTFKQKGVERYLKLKDGGYDQTPMKKEEFSKIGGNAVSVTFKPYSKEFNRLFVGTKIRVK